MEKIHTAKEIPADDVDLQPGQTEDAIGHQDTQTSQGHGEYQRAISPRQIHVRETLSQDNRDLLANLSVSR